MGAPQLDPTRTGDRLVAAKLGNDDTLQKVFLGTASFAINTVLQQAAKDPQKTIYFTSVGWKAFTSEDLKKFQETHLDAKVVKFSNKEIKTLLKSDGVVRDLLVKDKVFVLAFSRAMELSTNNSLKKMLISIGLRKPATGMTEKRWEKFRLEEVTGKKFTDIDPKDVENLKALERGPSEDRGSNLLTQFTKKAMESLELEELFAPGIIADHQETEQPSRVPVESSALTDPNALPYSRHDHPVSGDSSQYLRCKAYIAEGEVCGDYVQTEHYGSHSVSVVMDAAGNDPHCHAGARDLGEKLTKGLNKLVQMHGNTPKTFKEELEKLLNNLHEDHLKLTKADDDGNQVATPVTAAFSLRINLQNGKQIAIVGSIGDARALVVRKNGEVRNVSKSNYHSSYSDSGGAIGFPTMGQYLGSLGRPGAKPVQLEAFELEPDDLVVLGSDGLGDNLEAKTIGVSPKKAAQLLQDAGKLPEGVTVDSLPDGSSGWAKTSDSSTHLQLQKVHDAFIEYQAGVVLKGASDPAEALFNFCSSNPAVLRGAKRLTIKKEMEHTRKSISEAVQTAIENDPNYQSKMALQEAMTRRQLTEIVVNSRRATLGQGLGDRLNRLWRRDDWKASVNKEVDALIAGGTSASGISQEIVKELQFMNKRKNEIFLEIRQTAVKNDPLKTQMAEANNVLHNARRELYELGKAIVTEHPDLKEEWDQACAKQSEDDSKQARMWHSENTKASPVDVLFDGPMENFVSVHSMKPDDVGISTLKGAARPNP